MVMWSFYRKRSNVRHLLQNRHISIHTFFKITDATTRGITRLPTICNAAFILHSLNIHPLSNVCGGLWILYIFNALTSTPITTDGFCFPNVNTLSLKKKSKNMLASKTKTKKKKNYFYGHIFICFKNDKKWICAGVISEWLLFCKY